MLILQMQPSVLCGAVCNAMQVQLIIYQVTANKKLSLIRHPPSRVNHQFDFYLLRSGEAKQGRVSSEHCYALVKSDCPQNTATSKCKESQRNIMDWFSKKQCTASQPQPPAKTIDALSANEQFDSCKSCKTNEIDPWFMNSANMTDTEKYHVLTQRSPPVSEYPAITAVTTTLHSWQSSQLSAQAASDAQSYYSHMTYFPFIVAAVVSQFLLGVSCTTTQVVQPVKGF